MNVKQLRQYYQQQRNSLDPTSRQVAEAAVTQRVLDSTLFQQANNIASYHACRGELNPGAIIQYAWENHKQVYLPVIQSDCSLKFFAYHATSKLAENRFGIAEPDITANEIKIEQLDLILVPLLIFNRQCQRIGMGGGYYDRTLAKITNQSKPSKLGLAYECQRMENLPQNNWDVPLDFIATEQNLYQRFKMR